MSKIFQRTPGGSYYVREYRCGTERWRSLRTTSRQEAERKAKRIAYEAAKPQDRAIMRPPPVTFPDAWGWYLESPACKALKEHSLMQKAVIWRKFTAWYKGNEATAVTQRDAAMFILDVANTRSPSTARRYLTNLHSVWKAIGYRLDVANPWDGVPTIPSRADKTKQFRPFTLAEIVKIRQCLRLRNDEWADMFEIAIHTGLRMTDVVHIRGDAAKDGYIATVPAKGSRRGKQVVIPLHPAIRQLFGKAEQLFPYSVQRYDRNYTRLSQEFSKILSLLEITGGPGKKVGFHSTRATFITEMERAGVRRSLIQAVVGHGSPLLTAHYSQDHAEESDISKLTYDTIAQT